MSNKSSNRKRLDFDTIGPNYIGTLTTFFKKSDEIKLRVFCCLIFKSHGRKKIKTNYFDKIMILIKKFL